MLSHFSGGTDGLRARQVKKKKLTPVQVVNYKKKFAYLNVICRKDADHGIVLAFVPILIDLPAHQNHVSFLKRQLSVNERLACDYANYQVIEGEVI